MAAAGYDVVVVGARCAGSPLAAMLADRGLRVCVVDKADPATDTPSTHGIQPTGVRVLDALGLTDRLLGLTDPITRIRFCIDDLRYDSGDLGHLTGGHPMLSLRRHVLDPILAERAREAGAEVRTGTPVTDLLRDETGRVTGVVAGGEPVRAGLVVGADGVRSTVARLVGAAEYLRTPVERTFVWGYFDGATIERDQAWLGRRGNNAFLATATDAGLTMAAVALDAGRWSAGPRDPAEVHRRELQGWPDLADALGGARPVGRCQVMAHGHGFFRESAGPGWVLVGDAGHFKDPTPGQGIADALRQSTRLAPAIVEALGGAGDAPLLRWWRWRDRDALAMYWFARQLGAAGTVPDLMREMLAALLSTEAGMDQFVRVLNHEVSPDRVFGPRLLVRGLLRGWQRGRRRTLLQQAGGLVRQGAREQVASARPARYAG